MKQDFVYVLLEGSETPPLGVFSKLERPYLLPGDAVTIKEPDPTESVTHHHQLVGEWSSETLGCHLRLIAYVLQ